MKYIKCPSCDGSGMQLNSFNGEPDICKECMGGTVVPDVGCDFCADHVPAKGYWRCPKCDAEWPDDGDT